MRTVPYSALLEGVADLLGWQTDPAGDYLLDRPEWHMAKRALSKAYERIHNADFWRDLTRNEWRRYHPVYAPGDTINAGEFRFFRPTGQYYQALRETAGNPPATIDAAGKYVTDTDNWSDAMREVAADPWDASEEYAVGDQVYYTTTDAYYQAHTSGPAGTLPTDTDFWGEITALDAVVPYVQSGENTIGRIAGVWERDPEKYRGARLVPYVEGDHGIQILCPNLNEVWVKFLTRPWRFRGDLWDPALSYTPDPEDLPAGPTGPPILTFSTLKLFDTVAQMEANTETTWMLARCSNWHPGDRVLTLWTTMDPAAGLVPNGTDIRQTAGGLIVNHFHEREAPAHQVSVPPPTGSPYVVGVPVDYPTIADARLSFVDSPTCTVIKDINLEETKYLKQEDQDNPDTSAIDGKDWFVNAAGIYYRKRP